MLVFLDDNLLLQPFKEGGRNLIFEAQGHMRRAPDGLEYPREGAVEAFFSFDNEAFIGAVFDRFTFAFEWQARHLVRPAKVKALAVL